MRPSDQPFASVILRNRQNRDQIPYSTILLFDHELLLFPKGMFWGGQTLDLSQGNICINGLNGAYEQVGSWETLNDMIKLQISCKGIYFYLKEKNAVYEAEAEHLLEQLIINAVRNSNSKLCNRL